MDVATFVSVVVVAAVQSLFGVGVLLFGTPLLLILGHSFVEALLVLLPISVAINLLQITKHRAHVDVSFYKKVLIYTIPFIVLCLVFATNADVEMALPVGAFVFVALERFFPVLKRVMSSLSGHERSFLVSMGVVHGLTNLGGSLLTAIVYAKGYPRDTARVTTASAYCTFAVFQIATLAASGDVAGISWIPLAVYGGAALGVFALSERFVYVSIDQERYRLIFAVFLATSGAVLLTKAMWQS
jgi:hypothetical protein